VSSSLAIKKPSEYLYLLDGGSNILRKCDIDGDEPAKCRHVLGSIFFPVGEYQVGLELPYAIDSWALGSSYDGDQAAGVVGTNAVACDTDESISSLQLKDRFGCGRDETDQAAWRSVETDPSPG
jgi:hypothetical protein